MSEFANPILTGEWASYAVESATKSRWVIYVAASVPLLYTLHLYVTHGMRVTPTGVPWSGPRKGEWFAIPIAHIREWWRARDFITEGYQKYGKAGRAWLTPNRNWQPEVVLAPEQIKWLVDLPESSVSIYTVLIEDVAFRYTSPRSWNFHRPFHVEALNKMNLGLMTAEMVDEIELRTRQYLGDKPGEWESFGLNATMWTLMSHVTNRAFAGKELAHNDEYLKWNARFVFSLMPVSVLIKAFTPAVLQPVLGHILALPCRYYDRRCSDLLQPEVQRHMDAAQRGAAEGAHAEERNPNMLQLMARFAVRSSDPRDWDTHNLASRLLALNFVGIHTSSAAAINAWTDILLAGPAVYDGLRAEAAAVLRDAGGTWTKAAVARLALLDSALRESLRFSAFKARGVERQVVAAGGVTLPDGTHLPRGTKIGVPTVDIHRDEACYERADEFVPDRFVGKAELGMVNTTDTFLAFGHGRHACPGRFFSAHELKLLFAHILLNYDFKPLEERPPHMFVSDFFVPGEVKLQVRRREESAHLGWNLL